MSASVMQLVDTNPNRPTKAGYCANCGHAPCLFLDARVDYPLPMRAGTCRARPEPCHIDDPIAFLLCGDLARDLFPQMTPDEIIEALIDWQLRTGRLGTGYAGGRVAVRVNGRTLFGALA